jgi:hypothetical protein
MSGSPSASDTSWSVEGPRAWLGAAGVSFLTSLAILLPFFWLGTASGHDIQFHIQSWIDAAGQWKEGIVYPRWTEWANYGFGEPRFIFYPPLSWMLGAALGSVFPWTWIPGLFVFVVQTFAGLSAFGLLRKLLGTLRVALFCAALFAANPYALVVIYMRSDFAELLASAFLPLLLLAAIRLCGYLEPDQSRGKFLVHFGLLFAAVWLSNAPAGVLATYSLALLFLWAALTQRSLSVGLRGSAGIGLGFGLAGFYLIPAAYEQRWVNIAGALAGGLTPADNFLFAHTKDAEHDAFNHIASYVAVALIAGLIAAAGIRLRKLKTPESATEQGKAWMALLIVGAAASLMMLPLTNIFWTLLPKLRFVQFPWRWLGVLSVAFVIFISAAITRRVFFVACVSTALLLTLSGSYLVKHTWWDTEDVNSVKEAVDSKAGFEGTDEYDPLGDDHTDIPQNQPEAKLIGPAEAGTDTKHTVRVIRWTAEERIVAVRSSQPSNVALRLLHHPAWQVTLNGKPVKTSRTVSYDGIVIPIPAGESRIEARFARTADRTIGGCVTLLSLFIAGLLSWSSRPATSQS